jgi:hypothetical protein
LIIEEINQGNKITYSIDEAAKTITFNDSLIINPQQRQADIEKVVDLSLNKEGELVEGVSKWYVANIVIPAAEYELIDTGDVNEAGDPIMEKVKNELLLDEVKLILWGLPGEFNKNGGIE